MTDDSERSLRAATACAVLAGIGALTVSETLGLAQAVVAATGYAAAALMTHGDRVPLRTRNIWGVAAVAVGALGALASFRNLGHLCGVLVVAVAVAQAACAATRRDRRVAVVPPALMLVLSAGLAPGDRVALPLLLGWLAVLVAAFLARRTLHVTYAVVVVPSGMDGTGGMGGSGDAPGVRGRLVTAVAGAAVVGLLLFLVLPNPAGAGSTSRVRSALQHNTLRADTQRSVASYSGGSLDMRDRGDLGSRAVASVPADSPRLWRGAVLDTFDGVTWSDSRALTFVRLPAGDRAATEIPQTDVRGAGASSRHDDVRLLGGGVSVLLAPGTARAVTTPARLFLQGNSVIAPEALSQNFDYGVDSYSVLADPARLSTSHGADSGSDADSRWLQLPQRLTQRMVDLAHSLTDSAPTRAAAVTAVHDYVQASASYDLRSPVPRAGEDAVDDFLFVSRRGFCEQFAAAEVVLLRIAGIPARMVTGFSGGQIAGGRRTMRSSDAHAWVESSYPGVGWVASDPTPASTSVSRSYAQRLHAAVERRLRTRGGRATLAGALVVLAGSICAVGAVAAMVRRRRCSRRHRPVPRSALLTAWDRFEQSLARDGIARREDESLTELAARLPRQPGVHEALAAVQDEVYAPAGTGSRDVDHHVAALVRAAAPQASSRPPRP